MFASVFGVDAAAWSAVIAVAALGVSAYVAFGARGSAAGSKRSARAAEQAALATSSAAAAAERSAEAAEASAQHAERAAVAAERSASAQEVAARLDEERAHHERRERIGRDAPRWGPASLHGGALWFADDNTLHGALFNTGQVAGRVTGVELELPNGGGLQGRYRAEPSGAVDGGFVSALDVRPGGGMHVEFTTSDGSLGLGLSGDARPRITVTSSSEELGWAEDRVVELLRKTPGHQPALRWQPRAVD
jgi:hypothetical protein